MLDSSAFFFTASAQSVLLFPSLTCEKCSYWRLLAAPGFLPPLSCYLKINRFRLTSHLFAILYSVRIYDLELAPRTFPLSDSYVRIANPWRI